MGIVSRTDPARNKVAYTGINCGGHWTLLGRVADDYRFREVIDHGRGRNCKGVGDVTVTPISGKALQYSFEGGGVRSTGVLHRFGLYAAVYSK